LPPRHKDTKDFILLFFLSALVPLWRKEKSFATKITPVKLTLYFTGQAKFTTKELKKIKKWLSKGPASPGFGFTP